MLDPPQVVVRQEPAGLTVVLLRVLVLHEQDLAVRVESDVRDQLVHRTAHTDLPSLQEPCQAVVILNVEYMHSDDDRNRC